MAATWSPVGGYGSGLGSFYDEPQNSQQTYINQLASGLAKPVVNNIFKASSLYKPSTQVTTPTVATPTVATPEPVATGPAKSELPALNGGMFNGGQAIQNPQNYSVVQGNNVFKYKDAGTGWEGVGYDLSKANAIIDQQGNVILNPKAPTETGGLKGFMNDLQGYADVIGTIGGLASSVMNAVNGRQRLELMQDQLDMQRAIANRNIENQAKVINNAYDNSARVAAGLAGYDVNTAGYKEFADRAKKAYVNGSPI